MLFIVGCILLFFLPSFYAQINHFCDQFRISEAHMCPKPGEHTHIRKTRDTIDFIDHDFVVIGKKDIYSGEITAF